MKIKKNAIITSEVLDVTNLGFGVCKHEGEVVFVSGAVLGDVIEAKIIKVGSSFAVGRVEKFITRSPYRTEGRCSVKECKSCAYKQLDYEKEKEIKTEMVRSAFKKCGLFDVRVEELISFPRISEYRNKAQYPIALSEDGEYIIGFYAPKSHRVTEAADCPLAPPIFSDILSSLRIFFKKNGISVYNEDDGCGLLRHIYLRRGEVSGEILLTIVINGSSLPHSDELVSMIRDKHPQVVGILLNVNKQSTNVILGEQFITLWGNDYIIDTLAGVKLRLSAPAFYQVNHDCAELLYAKARRLAKLQKSDTLLDLYCGAGSIGLSMAADCGEIIGIEIVESAVECAKLNARLNGIKNASFYAGDAKNTERLLDLAEKTRGSKILPDVVILDPPRAGCDEALLRQIATSLLPRKIVYISCNPQTLARDCALLAPLGYKADSVVPVDMFPGTGHVESVCLLSKLNTKQHIEINLDMDELDLTDAEKKATYQEIKDYVLEHSGLKVSSLYIAQVKQTCGIIERENYNKPKSEDAKQPQCPPDKEKAIKEALKHFGMI